MRTTRCSRRSFLKAGALVSIGALGGGYGFFRANAAPAILSAAADTTDHYFGLVMDRYGRPIQQVSLPVRGHAAAYNAARDQVLFLSRRPGNQLFVFSTKTERKQVIEAGSGRHFYGHGVLSADQTLLFTTENNYESGLGVVAVRDARQDYQVITELPSYGVGPHELLLLNDQVLAVANGGIHTHPAYHREELNLQSMEPSVAFINWQSGILLGRFIWSNPKISLRHLAQVSAEQVVVAAQSHDPVTLGQTLVFAIAKDGQGKAMVADELHAANRQHYIASVAQLDERTTVTTSPRSGHIDIWVDGRWREALPCFDVAGVCRTRDGRAFVSNGRGEFYSLERDGDAFALGDVQRSKIRWDNHLVAVG